MAELADHGVDEVSLLVRRIIERQDVDFDRDDRCLRWIVQVPQDRLAADDDDALLVQHEGSGVDDAVELVATQSGSRASAAERRKTLAIVERTREWADLTKVDGVGAFRHEGVDDGIEGTVKQLVPTIEPEVDATTGVLLA